MVYGGPTYGKGRIQSVFALSDGSGLAVTVARFETPAHTDIDKVSIALHTIHCRPRSQQTKMASAAASRTRPAAKCQVTAKGAAS
uniref:Tail specific protease domain-containing protein n=1 Tax=Aegilops tauschii subsp. strangulata TaxID=200361 RepID=A0A453PS55_AEGTS